MSDEYKLKVKARRLAFKAFRQDGVVGMPTWIKKIHELAHGNKEIETESIAMATAIYSYVVAKEKE